MCPHANGTCSACVCTCACVGACGTEAVALMRCIMVNISLSELLHLLADVGREADSVVGSVPRSSKHSSERSTTCLSSGSSEGLACFEKWSVWKRSVPFAVPLACN